MTRLTSSIYRVRPHPNSPELLFPILLSVDHYPSIGEISHAFYDPLTSMLSVDTTLDSWSFSYRTHRHGKIQLLKSSHAVTL